VWVVKSLLTKYHNVAMLNKCFFKIRDKTMKVFHGILVASLVLVGCSEKQRTAEFYRKNADERKATLDKCYDTYKKGERPEGNFAINCETARQVDAEELRNTIRENLDNANR
jgi:hypothetical protein